MKIGFSTQEISRPDVMESLKALKNYGFDSLQFNMLTVLSKELPDEIPDSIVDDIVAAKEVTNQEIVAINGTFNMINVNLKERHRGIENFSKIASICGRLNCNLITLCTGTRNQDSMWMGHPDNQSTEAWRDLLYTTEQLLEIAERYDVNLGIETEYSNVINTPERAVEYIKEMQSDRMKIVMDCANLFHPGMAKPEKVRDVIQHGFDLLGEYVQVAHGKDICAGEGICFTAAGLGIIDFPFFKEKLEEIKYTGPMILHGFKAENQFAPSVAYLKKIF